MTNPAVVSTNEVKADQQVAIASVDPANFRATAVTRAQSYIEIDTRYHVGAVHVTPTVGDQWIVRRYGANWVLISQLPANTTELLAVVDTPVQGMTQVGSTNPAAQGPTHLNGSEIIANAPLQVNGSLGVGEVLLKDVDGVLQQSNDGGDTWITIAGGSGAAFLTGSVPPDSATGEEGDYYLDTDSHTLYGPKAADNTWPVAIGGPVTLTDIDGLDEALDAKADTEHTHTEDEVTGLVTDLASKAAVDHTHSAEGASLDPDLVDIGALSPVNSDFIQRLAGHWTNVSPGAAKTSLALSFPDITGILAGGQIPGLDCSKIISGEFLTSLIPSLNASKIGSGTFLAGLIPSLDASKIGSGTFLTGLIPGLDASKITTGTLLQSLIPTLSTGQIPNLDAAKITSGLLNLLRIPTLDLPHIPELPADQITSGTFLDALIPNLHASKITSGVLSLLRIPGLPADQVTSGTFPQSMLDITSIAAGIISGTLSTGQIPGLDAAKIIGGTLLGSLIPGLDASKITSGIFNLPQIPGLDLTKIPNLPASQITSGVFGGGLIPTLDATKIGSGVLDLLRLPSFPTSKITGTFPQTMIDNLTTNLGNIFSTITSPTRADLLQNVPVSSVGQFTPELLVNPNYDTLGSVFGGSTNWSWDPTVSHTAGGTGSAKVTADGTILQLLSDPPIPVSPNQVLAVSHWLQWSGVTGTGPCFRLGVQAYLGAGVSNTVDIQTISSPASSSGWIKLQGSYTVPATGVDNIRLQLTLHAAVTAGTVWWDDGSVKKTQLLNEAWTAGLPGDLNNLLTGINARALITDLADLMGTLGLGSPTLTAITNRLASLTAGGGFNAANLTNTNNIPKLLNTSVFGIGGIGDIGESLQQTWDNVSGVGAGGGDLIKINNRLSNLTTGGLFHSGFLSNIANIPLLPMAKIPPLDGTLIQFGKIPIGQLPIGTAPTELNRITLPDVGDTLDQLTNAWVGKFENPFTGTDSSQARQSMDAFFQDFLGLTQKVQDLRSTQIATNVSGKTVTVNFGDMADGPLPTNFTTTYPTGSGLTGTSLIGIKGGAAGWRTQVNDGNRTAVIVYNAEKTNTDFQVVRGTLASVPPGDNGGSMPRIAAVGRIDSFTNPRYYVWARGYCTGFLTYKGDVGCTINGVDTVWFSGIPLTWSMDISFVIGVGTNERRYQVFSGTQLVKDFLEPGTASLFGPNYRYWGCKSELKTDSGKVIAPPAIVGTSVSDNQPPPVVGSTFRAYRASTGEVNFSGWNKTPNNFFDSLSYQSTDLLWDGTNLTVGNEGTYLVNVRYATTSIPGGDKADVSVFRNNAPIRKMGGQFADNAFSPHFGNMFGTALVYLKVNDVLTPGYSVTATTKVNGEPGGTDTFFEVTLVNRSLA